MDRPAAARLVVLAPVPPSEDTRGRRVALAAARDGWDVTVVTPAGAGSAGPVRHTTLDDVAVVQVPVPDFLANSARVGEAMAHSRRRHRRLGGLVGRRPAPFLTLRGTPEDLAELDADVALGPVVEELEPTVIHAIGTTMLRVAVLSALALRETGREVRVVYDAVRPLSADVARFTRHLSAVVAATTADAETVRQQLQLKTTPVVVRNLPIGLTPPSGRLQSVRQTIARASRDYAPLPADTRLVVHVGRGLGDATLANAVRALVDLPDAVRLVIVPPPNGSRALPVRQLAKELGVRERLHLTHPVPDDELADLLRDADVVLVSHSRTRSDAAMPSPALVGALRSGRSVLAARPLPDLPDLAQWPAFDISGTDVDELVRAVTQHLRPDAVASPVSPAGLCWEEESLRLREAFGPAPTPSGAPTFSWRPTEGTPEQRELPWRRLARTDVRLGLGPANFAGQLAALAAAVTLADDDVSAEVFMQVGPRDFGYPADIHVLQSDLRRLDGQVDALRRILDRYTHLLADGFRPVFGQLHGKTIAGDLPLLDRSKVKVALLAHGSEIRHPPTHLALEPESYFHLAEDPDLVANITTRSEHNLRTAEGSGLPVFVTTPDLLDFVPRAVWVPLVVDVDGWACDRPLFTGPRPVVLHGPSKRWTKGTDRFLPSLLELEKRGLIELDLAENLPWTEMRARVQRADIVVDQVGVGSYGAFACEAMAAGKPVIAHLSERVLARVGPSLPIVNASASEVGDRVAELIADQDRSSEIGAASAAFTRDHHDGRRSAQLLEPFLRS